jgi:hypothetical protein
MSITIMMFYDFFVPILFEFAKRQEARHAMMARLS